MYCVYSDESGQSGNIYEDVDQPVLCQTAVIIDDGDVSSIENKTIGLLKEFRLPEELELHANPCLMGEGMFHTLEKENRNLLLKNFIKLSLPYIFKVHYVGMLKSFVQPFIRKKAEKAGLNPYMISFLYMIIIIDKYFEYIVGKNYKYYFDTTHNYRRKIAKSVSLLKNIPQDSLKIKMMIGNPTEISSTESRIIQISDVVGYYLNRHRQLEVGTFKHRESLDKHKTEIFEIYELLRPKFMEFIKNIIPQKIDWVALQNFDFISF